MLDSSKLVVGSNGSVRVAPVGTPWPTDIKTPFSAAWLNLGYVTKDGVKPTPSRDITDVEAWQSFDPIRKIVTTASLEIAFALQQWERDTLALAFGGGSFVPVGVGANNWRYDPPSPDELDERALAVEWFDGAKQFRWVVPRGMVTDTSDITIARIDTATLTLKYSLLGSLDGTSKRYYIFGNSPGFVNV